MFVYRRVQSGNNQKKLPIHKEPLLQSSVVEFTSARANSLLSELLGGSSQLVGG